MCLRAKKTWGVGGTRENAPAGTVKFMCHVKTIKGVVFSWGKTLLEPFCTLLWCCFLLTPPVLIDKAGSCFPHRPHSP